jgi:hypothetical protein
VQVAKREGRQGGPRAIFVLPIRGVIMKKLVSRGFQVVLMSIHLWFIPALYASPTGLPEPGNNKVAYYVFDSGGPDHFPLTSFTDRANIVVVFEGTLWELADSVHYHTTWMRNVIYTSYAQIRRDMQILRSRGVKVLMNVDDAKSWSTATPFTTWDGKALTAQEFAAFIKACVDSAGFDGISLDVEHGATGNASYIALLKEIGKYLGPQSADPTTSMYIAAIYSGGAPGSVIGKSKDITSSMNFVMDMAYFNLNYVSRFNQWADSIGASKTMVGVLNDFNDLANASAAAAWQPAQPPKAGIMVYAANNLKSYTDSVFNALVVPQTNGIDDRTRTESIAQQFTLLQNYPNPFNPSTVIAFQLPVAGDAKITIYDVLGREVAVLVDATMEEGRHEVTFTASGLASGVYVYRLTAGLLTATRKMLLMR